MKLTVLCFLVSLFGLHASNTYSQKTVTLKLKDVPVSHLLDLIENQTEYHFIYKIKDVDINRKTQITAEREKVTTVLDKIFQATETEYEIYGNQIFLTRSNMEISSSAIAPIIQETVMVSGKITEAETGMPVPAANILEKGTSNGVMSDFDGNYSIEVSEGAILNVSYIGYATQEIEVNGRNEIDIVLKQDAAALDEVVVVGYGTQKKMNVTGAVSQISMEEMEDRPLSNMTKMLQGAVPNLNINFGSGEPGQSGVLNIRGNTSINGGSPLVLIDGIPGNMDKVSPLDVESVTVLKDASASAIYGARAAFGVILITTKSGESGEVSVSYNANFGWTTHGNNTDFITSGYDYFDITERAYYNALGKKFSGFTEQDYEELEARRNDVTEHPDRPWIDIKPDANGRIAYKYYGNFDWYNYLYRKWRPQEQHNVSVTGGSEKIKYLLSGAIHKEDGVWDINPDVYKKNNIRAKIDAELFTWLNISNNTSYMDSNYREYGERNQFDGVTNNLSRNHFYNLSPAYLPANPDGTGTYLTDNGTYAIGYATPQVIANKNMFGNDSKNQFRTNFKATIDIMEELSITGNYSYSKDHSGYLYREVPLTYSLYPGEVETISSHNVDRLAETTRRGDYNVFNFYGSFAKSIGDHNLKILAGYNQEVRTYKSITSRARDLISEDLNDFNLATGEMEVFGNQWEWAIRGWFYRFNYDYQDKFLLEFSGRYDGTSRFPKHDRFGFFPSVSAGWRISKENFFEPLKGVINNLKLRGSYGSLGNQNVANYGYIPSLPRSKIGYLESGQRLIAVGNPSPLAPDLTWEEVRTQNIGVDINLLRSRLSLEFDTYLRETKGMLTKGKTLPKVFGAKEPQQNAADLETRGFELAVKWKDRFTLAESPFSYSIGINLSDYTSKITKFDNPNKLITDYYVGQQLGEIWGYKYDGFFSSIEEAQSYEVDQSRINPRRVGAPTAELRLLQAGDIKVIDINGDGKIDRGDNTVSDPGDRQIIGNSQPRYTFGIPLSANWKGFDLFVLFQGVGRQNWYPDNESQRFWNAYARPYGSFVPDNFTDKVWSPENPNSYFPFLRGYSAQNGVLSEANNMYLQDIGYVKLRNLTFGYSLPKTLINKVKLKNLRIYVSGENLFTWTKLDTDYIDPEEVTRNPTGRVYPIGKTLSFGLNARF